MNDDEKLYFSKEGFLKLKSELEVLKTKTRKEIAERLEFAKSLGDLSENSEYQEAKESQILNETKIAEQEDMLRRAVVVEKGASREDVTIGSEVVLKDQEGKEVKYKLVGSNEASPEENKISNESPLGKAIFGHKKFDLISVTTPKGRVEYKILDIL